MIYLLILFFPLLKLILKWMDCRSLRLLGWKSFSPLMTLWLIECSTRAVLLSHNKTSKNMSDCSLHLVQYCQQYWGFISSKKILFLLEMQLRHMTVHIIIFRPCCSPIYKSVTLLQQVEHQMMFKVMSGYYCDCNLNLWVFQWMLLCSRLLISACFL